MIDKITKLLANTFKLATSDLANQYAVPVKSMTGLFVSNYGATKSKHLNKLVVQSMRLKPDDFIFELGFGRGDALEMCFNHIRNGKGMVFGVERSGYMNERALKRFALEIVESGKIRIDSAIDPRNLPYPTDLFDHVFHVDLFYFLQQEALLAVNQELLRVLKPGGVLTCGMQLNRLKNLTNHRLLDETQWDPMRYMCSLEAAKFSDVQINYHTDPQMGEYQIISAQKATHPLVHQNPEELFEELAKDMKKERLAIAMMKAPRDSRDN
uniref:Methyltransf_25 domain-containing protein n=1 Tax=Caenorhabditis tropicalis TaxID=1561998 RepID=A0A1I7TYY3_9PELO